MRSPFLLSLMAISLFGFGCSSSPPPTRHPERSSSEVEGPSPLSAPGIQVDNLTTWQHISSPFTIHGSALGTWFFEATFPVTILTADGKNVLAMTHATADTDWMTTSSVAFTSKIMFSVATETRAILQLKKDDPSGLHENDPGFQIPILLEP